jgi:hypothetical protein
MNVEGSILWRRLDRPGHESARLSRRDNGWNLAGNGFAREPIEQSYRRLAESRLSHGPVGRPVGEYRPGGCVTVVRNVFQLNFGNAREEGGHREIILVVEERDL